MNKFAVVTGASSGIGLEFAKLLAADKYDLLLAARDKEGLKAVATKLQAKHGIKVTIFAVDLSNEASADKLWANTKNRPVDTLINNAGFGDLSPLVDADWNKLNNMINLNILTLTRLSQLAAADMKRRKSGLILNVASIAGFIPGPGMASYYATKAYVLSLTEAIAEELNGSGVFVTALCPGPTKTHFAETAGASSSGIFSGQLPSAKDVASYGYTELKKHKVVAVHGLKNKFFVLVLPRILPRSVIRKFVNKAQTPT